MNYASLKKGQNLTEIALVIGVVSLALIAMQVYYKRGIQGKVKDLTDNIIGKAQAVYQQDTSGWGVTVSKSNYNMPNSTTTVQGTAGGQKKTTVSESTTTDYYSLSCDPEKDPECKAKIDAMGGNK